MSYTLCSSEAIIRKAGANVSSTAVASASLLSDISDQAESQICLDCDYDFITNYANITTNLKPAIAKAVASKGAQNLIAYDPTGYLNSENQLILDVLENDYQQVITKLINRQKKFDKLYNG